ncbi:MAG: hypothetical protein WAW41_10465, partial [Methylobacter sp.]
MRKNQPLLFKFCLTHKVQRMPFCSKYLPILLVLLFPSLSMAADEAGAISQVQPFDLTQHWAGYLALIV